LNNRVKTGQSCQRRWHCDSPFPNLTVLCAAALSGTSSAKTVVSGVYVDL